ncbi:unnamed protein product, partial [Polarella glacialis]
ASQTGHQLSSRAADGSKLRLFGSTREDEVRVVFYRDHAAWCPYCQKVQSALEEKQVSYRIVKVNMNCYGQKDASFLAKNPMGLLPVAEVDGRLITDSNQILGVLEATFREHSLIPSGREDEVKALLSLERRLFGSWFNWLRNSFGDAANREAFERDLALVEARLGRVSQDGPYFLGKDFSIVECHFASFLERMAASLAYFKGFQMRCNPDLPHLE